MIRGGAAIPKACHDTVAAQLNESREPPGDARDQTARSRTSRPQVSPMTQSATSQESIQGGLRGRAGSVPATVGSLASRRRRHQGGGGDWLSPAVVVGILRVADAVIVLFAAIAAYITRFHNLDEFGTLELYGGMLALVLTTNILQLAGLYQFSQLTNLFGQSGRLLLAWAAVMLSLLALGFMTKAPLVGTSRLWVGLWFVYGFFGLFTARLVLKHQIQRWQAGGRLTRNLVIVGAGEHGQRLLEHLARHGDSAERVIGVFDDRSGRIPDFVGGFPVLGTVDDLLAFARRTAIDQIIVALPWDAENRLLAWMKKLRSLPVDVRLCPDMIGFHLPHRQVTHIGGVPMLNVFEKPLAGWNYIVKILEDRVLAAGILALIMPLLLLIAALIKLDSRGPVLFRQKRYGFNNEVIEVFKFRTMYVDRCEDQLVVQATKHDPRVTRIGRILRRTSLDELPQFLNVLMGSMSIVGPRPHAVAHNEQYSRLIDEYLARHRVKPGITGWAQVNGLRGETETLEKMEQRVRYDLYYIENWSLLFDIRIILRTLFVGFSHPNAY
jgi:Undecaprenyl-phosphate glucose phosphotransferase